jgi:hypothetical protein
VKLDPVVGTLTFPNGKRNPVFQDSAGRQYIIDATGWRSYRQWLPTAPTITAEGTYFVDQDETKV